MVYRIKMIEDGEIFSNYKNTSKLTIYYGFVYKYIYYGFLYKC
jgi:hypothetical protein